MKRINYIIVILILLQITACESFLDRPPLDQIGTENYWKTADDLRNYVLQYYPRLPSHGAFAGMTTEDANSDNMILAVPDETMNGANTINTGTWTSEWDNIRSVNIFFANYSKCEDPLDFYKQYLGEAHFFKAWFYFELVKKYGDVPWYSHPLYPDSEGLMDARTPRTTVIDSILVQLDKAILYLGTRSEVSGGNNQVNKEAALAFKTRVALYEGTWQKYHAGTPFATAGANSGKYFQACISAAQELMSGNYTAGIYSNGQPENDYYELFGLADMSNINEILFYKAHNSNDAMGNNLQYSVTVSAGQMGVTWELVSSYLGKDGTPYDYTGLANSVKGNAFLTKIAAECDPRLKSTIWIPGDLRVASNSAIFNKPDIDQGGSELCPTGFQAKKFSDPYASSAGKPWGGYGETGYIYFRYAEVLLNYAEAKCELDDSIANDQLNMLRARVGMPDFTINSQSSDPNLVSYGYSVSDALYEIRRERRVELALEGKRYDDYHRWAAHGLFTGKRLKGYPFDSTEFPNYNPPTDEIGRIDYLKNTLPNGYQFRPEQDYLSSIPEVELTLNPNLVQNPGW